MTASSHVPRCRQPAAPPGSKTSRWSAISDRRSSAGRGRTTVSDPPSAVITIVAVYVDDYLVDRLMAAGATSIVSIDTPLTAVFDIVAQPMTAGPGHRCTASHHPAAAAAEYGITHREFQVLRVLSEGHPPQQIARHLDLSVTTVRDHIKQLRLKLDCSTALQVVVAAHRLGLAPNLGRPLR